MRARFPLHALTAVLAGGVLCGCQSSNPAPKQSPPQDFGFGGDDTPSQSSGNALQPVSPDSIIATDPSASRLQDIGGYILLYYRDHQQMPPSLDELRDLPGGDNLNFNSGSIDRPFVYDGAGLWASDGGSKCIVAYDPVEQSDGKRWCLLMTIPKAGSALSVDVVALSESVFRNYKPRA
jgi:hypothetical protein